MGDDAKDALFQKAKTTLQKLHYNGRSKLFTFDKFVSAYRQACDDLGPDDQMSGKNKVTTFLKMIKIPDFQRHIRPHLTGPRKEDFERALTFIRQELMQWHEGTSEDVTRNISDVTSVENHSSGKGQSKYRGKGKSRSKQAHKAKGGSGGATKFDPKNPGQYLQYRVYKALPADQKAIVDAHRQQKNGSRKVSSVTKAHTVTFEELPPDNTEVPTVSNISGLTKVKPVPAAAKTPAASNKKRQLYELKDGHYVPI